MGTNSQVFTLTIRDSSGSPKITTIDQDNSGVVWCLLLQLNGICYCYDWFHSQFEILSYQEYSSLRRKNNSLEIKGNQSRQQTWLELPMATGKPAVITDKSTTVKKRRRIEPINEHFRSSQTETGLETFIRTERLLDSLTRDDY